MRYSWRCCVEGCNELHIVERSLKDIDVGPDKCTKCGSDDLTRTIEGYGGFSLVHGGKAPWFAETITSSGKPNGR
jgi:hypothetical protein